MKVERNELSRCQGDAWRMSCKLQSLGVILARQGEECEGFTELAGMGMILSELGEELGEIAGKLDDIGMSTSPKRSEEVI